MRKKCTKCKEVKGRDDFHRNKRIPDGLCIHCKACAKEYSRVWRIRNIIKAREYSREYYRHYRRHDRSKVRVLKETQTCYVCKLEKSLKWFSDDKSRGNGHSSKCKECHRIFVSTDEKRIQYKIDYAIKFPEIIEAHRLVQQAIRSGEIKKTPCVNCGEVEVIGHHHKGYNDEYQLDVIFMCHKCHARLHRDERLGLLLPTVV